jgi:hypothetical protein
MAGPLYLFVLRQIVLVRTTTAADLAGSGLKVSALCSLAIQTKACLDAVFARLAFVAQKVITVAPNACNGVASPFIFK